MKTLMLLISLLGSVSSFAQDSVQIIGKWKVVAMTNNRMFLDLRADSIFLHKTLEEKLLDTKDFNEKKELTRKVLKRYFDTAFYEFRKDLSYLEYINAKEIKNGTYSINSITGVISIHIPADKGSADKKEIMKYKFRDRRLILADRQEDNGANIEFEKQ